MGIPVGKFILYQRFGQRRLSALNRAAWLMGWFVFRQLAVCRPDAWLIVRTFAR